MEESPVKSNNNFILQNLKIEIDKIITEKLVKDNTQVICELLNKIVDMNINSNEINAVKLNITLKNLLKHENKEVQMITKKLISKCKEIIKTGSSKIQKEQILFSDTHIDMEKQELSLKEEEIKSPGTENKIKHYKSIIEAGKDSLRRNIKLLIYEGLLKWKEDDPELIFCKAKEIEEGLYNYFIISQKGQKTKFLKQAKQIVMNFQHNQSFAEEILNGNLKADKISEMDPKDFASEETKLKRKQLEEEAFNSRRSDWNRIKNQGTPGFYKCGKCKTYKTTYYQAQIRRADEPMTTFVTCLECNHSWKF